MFTKALFIKTLYFLRWLGLLSGRRVNIFSVVMDDLWLLIRMPVALLFNRDNHSREDMEVVPIDHNSSWTTDQRVAKENFG